MNKFKKIITYFVVVICAYAFARVTYFFITYAVIFSFIDEEILFYPCPAGGFDCVIRETPIANVIRSAVFFSTFISVIAIGHKLINKRIQKYVK